MGNLDVKVNLKRRPYRGVLRDVAEKLKLPVGVVQKRWSRKDHETSKAVLRELIMRDEREKEKSIALRELLARLESNG